MWGALMFGLGNLLFPQFMSSLFGGDFNNVDILMGRVGGIFMVIGSIGLMTIIYDIKISWCIKEKSE
jgi:hypothetical protein